MMTELLTLTDSGLYCPAGGFHIDPWKAVDRAVITHAHADHARRGSRRYLAATPGQAVLAERMNPDAAIDTVDYGQPVDHNGVRISLHPAGHVLGSSQVRMERRGQVAVVSGDYKLQDDPTCAPFEPLPCHLFLTESTFGLPVYRWPSSAEVYDEINAWWRSSRDSGRVCLLYAYALGKAQRVLAGLDPSLGPILCHGAVERMNRAYRAAGVALPATMNATQVARPAGSGAMVIAPPSAHGSAWTRRFGATATAFASGWMRIRGTRRRRAVDRGFVLSDHADWQGLRHAIAATGAQEVWVTHGYSAVLARWLTQIGVDARAVATRFEGESDAAGDEGELGDGPQAPASAPPDARSFPDSEEEA